MVQKLHPLAVHVKVRSKKRHFTPPLKIFFSIMGFNRFSTFLTMIYKNNIGNLKKDYYKKKLVLLIFSTFTPWIDYFHFLHQFLFVEFLNFRWLLRWVLMSFGTKMFIATIENFESIWRNDSATYSRRDEKDNYLSNRNCTQFTVRL